MTASYPNTRLRRTRATSWSRALHRETVITPADLIWPLFVTEGDGVEDPVASLPGVSRWSVDAIVDRAKEAVALGIPVIALFPNTQPDRRSDDEAEARVRELEEAERLMSAGEHDSVGRRESLDESFSDSSGDEDELTGVEFGIDIALLIARLSPPPVNMSYTPKRVPDNAPNCSSSAPTSSPGTAMCAPIR